MSPLTDLLAEATLKGSLLILLAAAAAVGLRRSSAAVRHGLWTAAIAGVLLIAPLALTLPAWRVSAAGVVARYTYDPGAPLEPAGQASAPTYGFASERTPPASAPDSWRPSLRASLAAIWAAGAFAWCCCFLVAILHLGRTAREAAPVVESWIARLARSVAEQSGVAADRVRLAWTDREVTPMIWGVWRPVVILPVACRTWDEERLRQVFVHEMGHIQRRDVLTQALGSAACALYWFNPLIWVAARQMLVERERACDDLVLGSGAKPSAYAHELLEIARSLGARWSAARVSPAMARRSQISGRLLAVLDPSRSRRRLERGAALITAAAAIVLVVPLAALGPATQVGADASTAVAGDVQGISAVYAQWENAIRQRDALAISMFHTADTVIVTEGRPDARGRVAVEELYRYYFANGLAGAEIHLQDSYAVGDLVCALGHSEAFTAAGRLLSASRHMTLWKKEAGQWRVHRDYLARQ